MTPPFVSPSPLPEIHAYDSSLIQQRRISCPAPPSVFTKDGLLTPAARLKVIRLLLIRLTLSDSAEKKKKGKTVARSGATALDKVVPSLSKF